MFSPLYSSTNQQLLVKRTSAIKITTMKITNVISATNGSYHMPTTKSALFAVSKDEWDTKEGTGKFMKNALYV